MSNTLVVQVRSDFAPVLEMSGVGVDLEGRGDDGDWDHFVMAVATQDWAAGVRVAETTGLPSGPLSFRVGADGADGVRLVERGVRTELRGGLRVLTVLLTRDCVGVMCPTSDPSATACLGGECVEPTCTPETPELCPEPECEADGDCTPNVGGGVCGVGTCLAGTCGSTLDRGRCLADEQCRPEGCVPGEVPAIDAGADSGVSIDAGTDAGPPDAGHDAGADAGPATADPCFDALGVICELIAGSDIKASNTGAGDQFGYSVSLSGDTLAVGAWLEDGDATGVNGPDNDNAADSGAVYVFVRDGAGRWSQQAYLKASNAGAGDEFGFSVSLSGDTLAVGSFLEDSDATGVDGPDNNNAEDSGAVYVFVRDGSGAWSQQAYLKASNTGTDDRFGVSVSVSGDTLAVGALYEDSDARGVDGLDNDNASNSGAVYVFVRDGAGVWSQQAYLKAENTGANDWFGFSVSLSGDTLAVGARYEDSDATGVGGPDNDNATDSGAVYVFVRDGAAVWSQQAYLKASNTGAGDRFGDSVSLSGDTLAVGALREDSDARGVDGLDNDNATDSGAVYVFVRDGAAVWSQQAYLKASNTDANDFFGTSLSLSGDTLAVGADEEDSDARGVDGLDNDNATDSGAVYVFVRDGAGTWSQRAYLKASNTGAGDWFGWSISLSGDSLAVGARYEDRDARGVDGSNNDNASNSGVVYLFDSQDIE